MTDEKTTVREKIIYKTPTKIAFLLGIMAGITLTSVAAFIMTYSLLRADLGTGGTASNTGTVADVRDTGTAVPSPTPTPATAPTADITVRDDDHIRGDKNAPITLVEYSDFECPFCTRHQPTLDQILEEYDGQVKLVYRHYPLSFHPEAQKAAEASECAGDQGQFWEMHDKLFALNADSNLSVANYKLAAGELGLKQSTFDNCLDDGDHAQTVTDELAEGTTYGVNGTPATFVNGQLVSGAVPFSSFKTIIDGLL
ncbi:DsbA family protein [Patescibacteria group bacterium]|nr:DsbA family protein [Patescibacteria group bacterium]